METKFWGYGFPFSSTLVFGEISDLARRRGLGMNAGGIWGYLYNITISKLWILNI